MTMAVVAISAYSPVLGKEAEAEALLKEGLEVLKRFGAQEGHVNALVLGGVQNTLSLVTEYKDAEAFGATLDAAYANTGSFIERGRQAQALVPVYSVEYTEIPGFEVPYDEIRSHSVVVSGLYRIHHGKQAQVLEWMRQGKAISEKLGAKVRMLQCGASDPDGVTATMVYYPSFAEYTRHTAALAADPEWKAYGEAVASKPPHADFLRTTVMRVL
jgi:hypothetical protein